MKALCIEEVWWFGLVGDNSKVILLTKRVLIEYIFQGKEVWIDIKKRLSSQIPLDLHSPTKLTLRIKLFPKKLTCQI